ncbi:hypothetical protein [Microbacterium sp. NPDC056234]|uniref:hypothetical protein n=1 Tax=Microbacterium sp. NPDC056234 TaxID=3345757 RepID=UPI0035E1AC36
MTEHTALIRGGVLSLCVALLGSVASWSVIQSGSTDGGAYLVVNAGLCVLGIGLLLIAWRRRRHEHMLTLDEGDDRSSTSSREPRHPASRKGDS